MQIQRALTLAVLSVLIYCSSALNSYAAGQVVTDEAREWARRAVQKEQSLSGAPDKNTVVILYFHNLTGRKELNSLEKGMTLMLLTDLSQVPGLQLVERIRMQALVEELKLGSSGLVERKSAPRVGKLVGVEADGDEAVGHPREGAVVGRATGRSGDLDREA